MVLSLSGPITLSQIRNEMNNGVAGPIRLNNFRSSGITYARGVTGIPSTGPLSMSSFRGKTAIPVVDGLIAKYSGESWDNSSKKWNDETGEGYDATSKGSVTSTSSSMLNSKVILFGGTSDGISFPFGVLPPTYTIFHLCRYIGSNKGRIIDGVNDNFLSGFLGNNAGLSYHGVWITPDPLPSSYNLYNTWVLSTDQKSLYRANRVDRTLPGITAQQVGPHIAINNGMFYSSESSDWACAVLMVYNRTLTLSEILLMEKYLLDTYNYQIVNRYNYYSVMSRQNWLDGNTKFEIVQSGTDSDVQLQMNSKDNWGNGNSIYMVKNLASLYKTVIIDFEVYIPTTANADGLSVYIGASAPQYWEAGSEGAWTVGIQVYNGAGKARGIYLYNSTTQVASYLTETCNGAWTQVRVMYTRGTSNTWIVMYNNITVITYSDPDNASWISTAGDYWGIGCRVGGATGDFFIRHVDVSTEEIWRNYTVNYMYTFTNQPYVAGIVTNTSLIWYTVRPDYWTGAGTPYWLCEYASYNQSANKSYEYIYFSQSVSDVPCQFAFQCDNSGSLNLNDVQLATNDNFTVTTFATANIKYGYNRIHIANTNADPGGAGGIICSCKRISDNVVLFISDSSWKMN